MAKVAHVGTARKAFTDLTGALEDATLIATEGQSTRDLAAARQSCDRLIGRLNACLRQLQRLRRRLE